MDLPAPWSRIPRVHDNTNLFPTDVMAALTNQYGPFVTGTAGTKYQIITGVIRNFGAPDYWKLLDDGGHKPTGIISVETTSSLIRLNYNFQASRVGTLIAAPDETLAKAGWTMGCSVEGNTAFIELHRNLTLNTYISWNGTAWVSSSSDFTIDSSAFATQGTLTLNHKSSFGVHNAQVSTRGAVVDVVLSEYNPSGAPVQSTLTRIQFIDRATNTVVKTPSTGLRAYVQRADGQGPIDPRSAITTTTDPLHNIWLFGLHETVTP